MTTAGGCVLKVDTKENESDLLGKIHEAGQFERLNGCCMAFQASLMGETYRRQPPECSSSRRWRLRTQ